MQEMHAPSINASRWQGSSKTHRRALSTVVTERTEKRRRCALGEPDGAYSTGTVTQLIIIILIQLAKV